MAEQNGGIVGNLLTGVLGEDPLEAIDTGFGYYERYVNIHRPAVGDGGSEPGTPAVFAQDAADVAQTPKAQETHGTLQTVLPYVLVALGSVVVLKFL